MNLEDMILRASLLQRLGAEAAPTARRLTALHSSARGRSCLDAGAPLQFAIDAASTAPPRIGVQIGTRLREERLVELLDHPTAEHFVRIADRTPAARHNSVGRWLFWSRQRTTLYVDLRDPNLDEAIDRAELAVGKQLASHVRARRPRQPSTRPWALRLDIDRTGLIEARMLWLVDRSCRIEEVAEELAPGRWPQVHEVFAKLVRNPQRSGRFVVEVRLGDETDSGLTVGSTGWALVPEDDAKRRALAAVIEELGGARDQAEALWSLCRADAPARWKVGRACEVNVTDTGVRAELFLVPAISAGQDSTAA